LVSLLSGTTGKPGYLDQTGLGFSKKDKKVDRYGFFGFSDLEVHLNGRSDFSFGYWIHRPINF
jgi:hypothetical protein